MQFKAPVDLEEHLTENVDVWHRLVFVRSLLFKHDPLDVLKRSS